MTRCRTYTHAITIVLLFVLLSFQALAQNSLLFSSMPLEKELSSKHITCFFQDSKGFMWIGTENGLNLYNANSVKPFKHDLSKPNSLMNNLVLNICEDARHNIWISTEIGISKLNTNTLQFTNYTTDSNKNSLGYKCKAFADRQGNIWVAGNGLFKLNPSGNAFVQVPLLNKLRLNGFLEDKQNRIWLSSFNGLFLFNQTANTLTRFDSPPNDDNYKRNGIIFLPVHEDAAGDLFVGTWAYGMFRILPQEKKLQSIEQWSTPLHYCTQTLNNRPLLWYASNGFMCFDKSNNQLTKLQHQRDNPFSPRSDAIAALFTDRQGQLWVGYASSGIQVLNPENQLVKTHSLSVNAGHMRSVNVFAEKEGNFYIGGWYNDALCKTNKDFSLQKWWKHLPASINGKATNVSDIYVDRSGIVWVSTFNGLVAVNEKNNTETLYRFDSAVSKNSHFIDFLPEGDSVLWISCYDNGLARFSLSTHRLEPVKNNGKLLLWKIDADQNFIWCANNAGVLLGYDKKKEMFKEWRFDSLTGQTIYYDIRLNAQQDKLYIASSSGLLAIDVPTMKARLFTEKDGLPANSTNTLEWENSQQLWIGTSEGLSVFNTNNNSFRNFYTNNGLTTERIEHGLYRTANHKLLIGTEGSFMEMNTANIQAVGKPFPVTINQVTEADSILQPIVRHQQKTLDLSYHQNNLSFEFAMPDYSNPESNRLFYQLQGWDKDFIDTKKGVASYQKLPPGKYIFKVKGINHDGIESRENDSILIIIHPPFWKTWWFIALSSILLLLLLVYIVRYISQRNLKEQLLQLEKEQAIEKERNRISRDMHDELGSGLTKIAIMSEVVKKQLAQPSKAEQQLENISTSSRELVDSLQDIIWTLNPKNDTLESLVAYTREYAVKFLEPFNIQLVFTAPDNLFSHKLSEEARRNIFLTIKETLNNIAKHAQASQVLFHVAQHATVTTITITDNGKGFYTNNTKQFGNGLKNMQVRMQQIHAVFHIESTPGKGTVTNIQLNH